MIANKPIKVAIFVDGEFIPSFSGATNRFQYLTRALNEDPNIKMVVILCDRGWSDLRLIEKEQFTTYVVHSNLFKDIKFLKKILEVESIDVLQFSTLELIVEVGIPLSTQTNTYLIFESHYDDYEFAKSIGAKKASLKQISYLQNTFGKYFDKVVALSDDDTVTLSSNLNIKTDSIAIIPSGVSKSEFHSNAFSFKEKKILFFGNLFFNVNLIALKLIKQKVYPKLYKKGFIFSIIGDISKDKKRLLTDKNFTFTGKQSKLAKHFKNSTIALAPVLNGSGIRIKILNYLNAGIPVITTDQGARGFPRKELLIIENDLNKYPQLISNLSNNKNLLLSYSNRGKEFVQNFMSWENIADRMSQVYLDLLHQNVTNKEKALDNMKTITFNEPAWITEVIEENRFKRNRPFVKVNTYIKIN